MRRSVLSVPHVSKCLTAAYGGVGNFCNIPSRKFALSTFTANNIKYAEIPKVAQMPSPSPKAIDPQEKPSHDQLLKVYNSLQNSLPKLFIQPMDYSVYSVDVVFINNIRNKTTQGIVKYVQQVALLRATGHFKFAYVKFEILNMSLSEEECRITVRWRIRGISGLRVFAKFWKFKLWKWKEIMDQQESWYDGISYFDVGPEGSIYRHIADKVMEDKERQTVTLSKAPLAAKMGVLAALLPQPSLQNIFSLESLICYLEWQLVFLSQVPVNSHYCCKTLSVDTKNA